MATSTTTKIEPITKRPKEARNPRTRRDKTELATVATTKPVKPPSRAAFLIGLMRTETGQTAQQLAEAVGWQVHSVRGFISGTLKKRTDLTVVTAKIDGVTRYAISDVVEAAND